MNSDVRVASSSPVGAVVAIPVKDEEEHLADCLAALAAQEDDKGESLAPGAFGIVVLLNNCRDNSAEVMRRVVQSFPFPLIIVERELPSQSAHAGAARRIAMDLAAEWLEASFAKGKLLLTTDADSRVGPRWVTANLKAAAEGADAIAGRLSLDPEDALKLPPHLHERGRLESAYESRLIEINALLDPRPHNPWPHHATASGATLAVTLEAYRRVGGLPQLALGEDRGLIEALELRDARIRFAPDIEVVTSGRLVGRASGGVADTIKIRCEDPDALCDQNLEPARTAVLRAGWRAKARALYAEGGVRKVRPFIGPLCERDCVKELAVTATFGELWKKIEERSPWLHRRRLAPAELPDEIVRAEEALSSLRKRVPSQNV